MMKKNNNKDDNFEDIDFDNESFDADYYDTDTENLEEGSFEEDWNIEGEDSNKEASQPLKTKNLKSKKSTSFNTIVIVGAFIVGALVLAFNVMSQSNKQSQTAGGGFQSSLGISDVMDGRVVEPQGTTVEDAPKPVAEAVPEISQDQQQIGGFLDEASESVPEDSVKTDVPPTPAPITTIENPAPDITAMPEETEKTQEQIAVQDSVASAEDILKQAMAKRENTNPSPSVTDIEALQEAPLTPDSSNLPVEQEDTKVATTQMNEKLDLILSRLDGVEKEIATLKSEDQKTKDNLETVVADLKESVKVAQSKPITPVATVSKETEQSIPDAPVKKKAPIVKPKVEPKSQPSQPKAQSWELRAAQPGRAWISKKGEKDMRSVEVGQTITGLGVVRSIQYENGIWSIVGSEGKIVQ